MTGHGGQGTVRSLLRTCHARCLGEVRGAHRAAGGRRSIRPFPPPLRCAEGPSEPGKGFIVGEEGLGYNVAEVLSMRVQSGQIAVGLAALLLGLMVVVQMRLQKVVPPPTATNELLTLLKQADNKRSQLSQEVAHLNMQLDKRLSQQASAAKLKQLLTQDEILAGTVPVTGPGVVVKWSNGNAPAAYQLTDIDLLLLVNELRAAGAEAIAINGQRITAQTEIRSAAGYILINDSQSNAPFIIQAIGTPSTLAGALTLSGGLFDQSQQEGLSMTIKKTQSVNIPAAPPAVLTNISQQSATSPSP